MVLQLLLSPVFLIIAGVIGFLPMAVALPSWSIDFFKLIQTGLNFFPSDVFWVVIANIAFWLYLQMTWAIVEWIYKKIPGIS